jgi:hypothetical protein
MYAPISLDDLFFFFFFPLQFLFPYSGVPAAGMDACVVYDIGVFPLMLRF